MILATCTRQRDNASLERGKRSKEEEKMSSFVQLAALLFRAKSAAFSCAYLIGAKNRNRCMPG